MREPTGYVVRQNSGGNRDSTVSRQLRRYSGD